MLEVEKLLDIDTELWLVLNKRIQTLDREERRLINSSVGKEAQERIEKHFRNLCRDIESRKKLRDLVINRIVQMHGDRTYLDKLAIKAIGPQEVYPAIKEVAKDQELPWRTQNTQGGCLAFLIFVLLITAIYFWINI